MVKLQRMLKICVCVWMLSVFAGCASTPKHESTGEYIDDSAITTKVKSDILKELGLKVTQVDVSTYRGVVQLSGFVDSQDEVTKAGEVASRVKGVKQVINNLVVKPE